MKLKKNCARVKKLVKQITKLKLCTLNIFSPNHSHSHVCQMHISTGMPRVTVHSSRYRMCKQPTEQEVELSFLIHKRNYLWKHTHVHTHTRIHTYTHTHVHTHTHVTHTYTHTHTRTRIHTYTHTYTHTHTCTYTHARTCVPA